MKSAVELARLVAAGERTALETLLDSYGSRVARLARRFTVCEADADDLTQEIFLEIVRSASSFRGDCDFGTWIYRIALRRCSRFQEQNTRRQQAIEPSNEAMLEGIPAASRDGAPEAGILRGELQSEVRGAIDKLPPHHRDVVILHELHGLTYAQCAAALEVPVGTVKSRLSNAFRTLRTQLAPYVVEDESSPTPARTGAPQAVKSP